jgi:hypothetical protein
MTTDKKELPTSAAFAMQFDSASLLLRTTMPAQVTSVDLTRNTVSVQPCLQGKMANAEAAHNLPIINDVQVQFFGAGDLWITFEPVVGAYCVLSISDRSLEVWKKTGGIVDPVSNRHHQSTDAFAYFGINPFPDALPDVQPGTMHIRTRDGLTGIKVKTAEIIAHIGGADICTLTAAAATFTVPVIAPDAEFDNVVQSTHNHPQAADSAGNSQQNVGPPE